MTAVHIFIIGVDIVIVIITGQSKQTLDGEHTYKNGISNSISLVA